MFKWDAGTALRLIERERLVDPDGRMWHRLLTSTGQPDFQSS